MRAPFHFSRLYIYLTLELPRSSELQASDALFESESTHAQRNVDRERSVSESLGRLYFSSAPNTPSSDFTSRRYVVYDGRLRLKYLAPSFVSLQKQPERGVASTSALDIRTSNQLLSDAEAGSNAHTFTPRITLTPSNPFINSGEPTTGFVSQDEQLVGQIQGDVDLDQLESLRLALEIEADEVRISFDIRPVLTSFG